MLNTVESGDTVYVCRLYHPYNGIDTDWEIMGAVTEESDAMEWSGRGQNYEFIPVTLDLVEEY